EGETAPNLRVDADVAEHLRMHHAASENLHPAGLRAGAAAGSAAEDARHVDFRPRIGEWEEAGAHAHLRLGAEKAVDHVLQRGPQMSDVDALVDQQPLGL